MYHKWVTWQEDAALDSEIFSLIDKRKNKRIEIYYHQHILAQYELITAKVLADLVNAQNMYETIDLELALIDGRRSFITNEEAFPKPKPKKKSSNLKEDIKSLSLEQRLALIEELKKL